VVAAAKEGASVVFCGRCGSKLVLSKVEGEAGAKVIAAARSAGVAERVSFVSADVSSEADIDRLFDLALERLPDLHVLVNNLENAAVLNDKPLIEISLTDWNKVLATNLRQPFLLSRRAIQEFLAGGEGGRIVHITSADTNGATSQASYTASRTALRAFIRSIAKEYGRRGIACNAVATRGNLETEMTAPLSPKEPRARALLLPHHLRCQPELVLSKVEGAVAEAVLFLASDEASFVNGEVLFVAGTAHEEKGESHDPTL